jgi:hypothetical protein
LIDDRVAVLLVDSTYFTKNYDDAGNLLTFDLDTAATDGRYVKKAGDTMTGDLHSARTTPGQNIVTYYETAGGGSSLGGAFFELSAAGGSLWSYIRMHGRVVGPTGSQIDFGVNSNDTGYNPPSDVLQLRPNGAYVFGALVVSGNLAKGSGTFLIDHPLDPDNKDLVHGFIEAPRFDLIYRGRVQLVGGEAEVNIDLASGMANGTFEALVKNVQFLPPYAETGWDKVRIQPGSVDGSHFTIECENGASTAWVSWAVIAERNDPFINSIADTEDGSLIVERDKPAPDEGLLADADLIVEGAETSDRTEVVSELIGTQGYRRHARETGEGSTPTRTVHINPEP